MAFIIKEIPGAACPVDLKRVYPLELADPDETGIAPAGCPIMSVCMIVSKMKMAVSDGEDHWFLAGSDSGKSVAAGESWAGLF